MKYLTFICILIFISCSQHTDRHYTINTTELRTDSIEELLNKYPDNSKYALALMAKYKNSGDMSKLKEFAHFHYKNALQNKDFAFAGISASYLAGAYISLNMADSAKTYLDFAGKLIDIDNPIYGSYNNEAAQYYMRFEFDYPNSITHLKRALNFYKTKKDTTNQSIILANIATIYCIKADTTGIPYAKESYTMSKLISDEYAICISATSLSQLEYLAGKMNDAAEHIKEVIKLARENENLYQFLTGAYTIAGDIYTHTGEYEKAMKFYKSAYSAIKYNTDKNISIKLDMSYAEFKLKTGSVDSAKTIFLKYLNPFNKTGNADVKILACKGLAETYEKLGITDSALYWYKQYNHALSNVIDPYKEKEFNDLLVDYEKVKYELDLQRKEFRIIEYKRNIILISAILVIVTILAVTFIYIYIKKDRMYTTLVEQHQQSIQQAKLRAEMENESRKKRNDTKSQNERNLFERLENLMTNEKIFKQTDLTLEKIAAMLDSNRTYLSSVINTYSGMTFPNYLNKYRINEAIAVISDTSKDITLKSIYSEMGYKSMTAYYRAFQKETGCTPSVYREKILKISKEKGKQ